MLAGCATPARHADEFAAQQGWVREVHTGTGFRHVLYSNHRGDAAQPLHVYLEGDGRPYLDRRTVSPDPTPRQPVMLELMALDEGPAVYVGRPCYFGLAQDPPCSPLDWTLGRFGEPVVASLAQVIEQSRRERGHTTVHLYGHSGGGALAVLLAARLPDVTWIVTLAGNLDPEAWARHHGYTPLVASLNPVEAGPLPGGVRQLHLAGADDTVMPASIVVAAAARLGAPPVEVLPGVGHSCCWAERGQQVLREVR